MLYDDRNRSVGDVSEHAAAAVNLASFTGFCDGRVEHDRTIADRYNSSGISR
jgi:hypothetical protein